MRQLQAPELYVQTIGQGDPIVLIHGGASSHRYWQKIAPDLATKHQVIMPDLLGMGDSPKPTDSRYSVADQVAALELALEKAGVAGKYSLLGHSIGAIVAVALAVKQPERIERLVLSAPEFFTSPAAARRLFGKAVAVPNWLLFGPIAWLSCQVFCRTKVVPRLIARMTFKNLPATATNDVTSHTWKSYKGMRDNLILNQHALDDLASLKIPVDVVIGTKDPSMEPEAIDRMQSMSNVKLHLVPNGHNLPYSQTGLLVELLNQ